MISVIMLTYNRERIVGRAIESILGQTYQDFEFIIVDNGSTDRSGQIADEYAAEDSRIRVIHRERGSIGAGRNTGLDAAKGEYIAFIDDDDVPDPDFLEFLHNLAEENRADIAICGATWANIDEKRVMDAEQAVELLLRRKHYNVAFPTKLFRREMFDKHRFLENSRYDDIDLMPKMIADANIVAYHGLSKYHFDRHGGNHSAWTQNHKLLDAETLREYLKVYRERTAWLTEKFPDKAELWNYFNWSFMISMTEKIIRLEISGCEEQLADMKHELRTHREAFLNSPEILEFEREWMERYVEAG